MTPANVAQVCHEANRALQVIQQDPTIPISPEWADLDPETMASAVDGVVYHLANPGVTPEESHNNWVAFKLAHGWTVGPVKDEELKQHPLLIPYSELPESQQLKDRLFSAIVEAFRPEVAP